MGNSRANSRRRKKAKNGDSSAVTVTGMNSDSDTPFLHDDSIEEIFSRLPIKDVLRFKCVSKSAVNLISDRDFIDKNMKLSRVCVPLIVVKNISGSGGPQYLVDKWWESNRKKSKIVKKCHLHPEYRPMLSSQDGLIVSKKKDHDRCVQDYIIFNPIFRETLELTVPKTKTYDGPKTSREMLGVFYRPCVKEYSTLWELRVDRSATSMVQYSYEMLDLCSQSKWRKIEYPFCQYYRFSIRHGKPVLINGFLYWVCDTIEYKFDIMAFDTSIEGFDLIPWPDTAARAFDNSGNIITSLLNGNGVLKLVQFLDKEVECEVNIWALNDHVKKIWSSTQYRIICTKSSRSLFETAQIITLWNEELVLGVRYDNGRQKGTFVCNLKLGITRRFGRLYRDTVRFMPHVMSLAPIKNLKIALSDESIE